MKFCVLGSKGFLGKNISFRCTKAGADVIEIDRSVVDLSVTDLTKTRAFDNGKIDAIFHCVLSSNLDEQFTIDKNVIDWWRTIHPDAVLITFGSDAAYSPYTPHKEDYYARYDFLPPWKKLAETKQALYEELLESSNKNWLHLVITSLYGFFHDRDDNHFVHDILNKMIRLKKNNISYAGTSNARAVQSRINPFPQLGEPSPVSSDLIISCSCNLVREVVFVEDLIDNALQMVLLNAYATSNVWNLGAPSKIMTTSSMVESIASAADWQGKIVYEQKNDIEYPKHLDSSTARAFIGIEKYCDSSFLDTTRKLYAWKDLQHFPPF